MGLVLWKQLVLSNDASLIHVPLISTYVFCCFLKTMYIFASQKKPQAAVLKPFKLHEAAWTHLLPDVSFSFTGNLSHMSVPSSTISPDCWHLVPAMFSYSWVHIFYAENMNQIEWSLEKHHVSELFFISREFITHQSRSSPCKAMWELNTSFWLDNPN